jgi:lysophospholipase L1-like esterase
MRRFRLPWLALFAAPDRLPPPYGCGDHPHPSAAGYRAMAAAIALRPFAGRARTDR